MALAFCLLFDPRTDRLVRELWKRLEQQGIATLASHTHGRHLPHLSYAVLLDHDLSRVREAADALPDRGGFSVTVQGTVVFPRGRAALAPALPPDLATRQAQLATALAGTGATLHRHYQSGRWLPHVSVATRAVGSALRTVVVEVSDMLPLTATVDRAVLIETATGEQWPVSGIP
ncbi:MAG: 2'-5' RNA ligase family protein [Micrococcales bacterium]|nr:2'-5' RNA ligase family protein [Micrococcales bacterium]